jgi:tripartite-type tricarboxylate transporter receptor subunit TctC
MHRLHFEVVNWYGVLAPAGTPRSVLARAATDMTKTVGSPEVKERLIAAGLEIVESTPAQFAAFRKADLAGWARMIKEGNIRLD